MDCTKYIMALTVLYGIGSGVSGKTENAASPQSIENTGFLPCKRWIDYGLLKQ